MPTPPRRRWLQFGMGTMLLLVTLFAVWLGWQLKLVRERKEILEWARRTPYSVFTWAQMDAVFQSAEPSRERWSVPIWRQWLGDEAIRDLILYDPPEGMHEQAQRLFPECADGEVHVIRTKR